MLEADLITHLKSDSAVTTLLGSGADCRIYPLALKQETVYPAAMFARTDTPERVQAHDGPTGFAIALIEIEAWSPHYLDACQVMEAFRRSLDAFRATVGATVIDNIEAQGPSDLYAEDPQLFGRHMEFRIQYHED